MHRGGRELPQVKQGGVERPVGLQPVPDGLCLLGQREQLLPQCRGGVEFTPGGITYPESALHEEERWRLPELLTEFLGPRIDALDRWGRRALHDNHRRTM